MTEPRDTLHIRVEYFTGQEEGAADVGYPYCVASCEEIVAVTDGKTWGELMQNTQVILAASFEDEDLPDTYGLTSNPRIVVSQVTRRPRFNTD